MGEEKAKKGKATHKLPVKLLIPVAVIAIIVIIAAAAMYRLGMAGTGLQLDQEGEVTTITESTLQEVFEISELSTVDYAYNAIAYAYDGDGDTPVYYVAYEGTVTAGIDFSDIDIDVDEETREITLTVPECKILDTIVDFGSMEYIFVKEKYNTETVSEEAYKLCIEDLAGRASQEEDLLSLAQENALAAIEALVVPWVDQLDSSYTVTIQ